MAAAPEGWRPCPGSERHWSQAFEGGGFSRRCGLNAWVAWKETAGLWLAVFIGMGVQHRFGQVVGQGFRVKQSDYAIALKWAALSRRRDGDRVHEMEIASWLRSKSDCQRAACGWKHFTNCQRRLDVKAKIILIALSGFWVFQTSLSFANANNGKNIYLARCAICHGESAKGTGPLASKSNPPTPNLATPAFRKRLNDYPGVIVSSIILRPNGDLIPRTLRENGVRLPPYSWTINDLRDLNEYMVALIAKK